MHHNDAPDLDPRTDITDLFVFQTAGDKSVMILNVNPDALTRANAFDPEASYEWKIDTNGDFEAEIAFHVLFASASDGQPTATVYRATGAAAQGAGPVGEVIIHQAPVSYASEAQVTTEGLYRFYAGLRSDPFFADRIGFQNNMQWTGQDYFADKNVVGIVLEMPNSTLGPNPQVGLWGRTMALVHGTLTPVNQMGRPGTNIYRQGADTNATPPAQQRGRFLPQYIATFQSFGYSEAEATRLAREWLPDILPYTYSSAAGYPNGRKLTDHVTVELLQIITHGKVTIGDQLEPHTDLLDEFPFLGPPHGQ